MAGQTQMGTYSRRGIREPSYEVKPEWQLIQTFNKQRFDKLPNLTPGIQGQAAEAGEIHEFNTAWEKCTIRKSKRLGKHSDAVPDLDITADDIIVELAIAKKAQVFMTDSAAAAIMCSSKAVFSWDLVIKKQGKMIFVDKREEENMLDWQTVSETAQHDYQPHDEDGKNGVRQLMKEAA